MFRMLNPSVNQQANTKLHRRAVSLVPGCICLQYFHGLATLCIDAGVILVVLLFLRCCFAHSGSRSLPTTMVHLYSQGAEDLTSGQALNGLCKKIVRIHSCHSPQAINVGGIEKEVSTVWAGISIQSTESCGHRTTQKQQNDQYHTRISTKGLPNRGNIVKICILVLVTLHVYVVWNDLAGDARFQHPEHDDYNSRAQFAPDLHETVWVH